MLTSRAACFDAPGKISLREKKIDSLKDNEVLVKTFQASICGTDKLHYKGELPEEIRLPILIWGHEGGGIIEQVGAKVHEFSVGDKVMSFGLGTYSDYFILPVKNLIRAPKEIEIEIMCLGEPLACAIYAASHVNVTLGDVVVVIGQGFAGQVIQQGVKKAGAESVIVIDIVDGKLELAKRLGADVTINSSSEDARKTIFDLTNGRGADVVIEASGSGEGLNLASSIITHNGTIAIYSHYMKPFMVNMFRWHEDALNIIHTCLIHHSWEKTIIEVHEAFRLFKKELFNIPPLITKRFNLSEIAEAFTEEQKNNDSIKTVILP